MDELEPFADEGERFVEPALERAAQMLVDGRANGVHLLAHLESLACQVVAQAAFEPFRQSLGGLEAEDQRVEVDGRLASGDEDDRREGGDLEDDERDDEGEHRRGR